MKSETLHFIEQFKYLLEKFVLMDWSKCPCESEQNTQHEEE